MTGNNPMQVLANQFGLQIVDESKSTHSIGTDTDGSDTPKTSPDSNTSESPGDANTTDKQKKDAIPEDAPVGSITNIKSLYQGPEDSQGRRPWLDKYPEDAEEAAENEETDKYALIARKAKCFDGRKKFDIKSIVVHSPDLKRVLGLVFDGYPGLTCQLERLEFDAPFEPFVHRWLDFTKAVRAERDPLTKDHLELLQTLLREELKDVIKAVEDYVVHGVTTFKHLWAIFQPGAIVYSAQRGLPRALKFYSGSYQKDQCGENYQLRLEPIEWDGDTFGVGDDYIAIYSFAGTRPIRSLSACPLALHPEKETIRSVLVKRGKKYEELAGYHYKAYKGIALTWNSKNELIPITVDGRIIIDAQSFRKFNPHFNASTSELSDEHYIVEESTEDDTQQKIGSTDYQTETAKPKVRLTSEAHLICKTTVQGYSLTLKKWLYFVVDNVREIVWNDHAFEKLVLPADTKDLLLGFVESQIESANTFDDVISGKGKGIIMLLSGPPGVGKTLTAESVAESMHIPLYMMSAGELGIRPDEVEESLRDILEMVAKWNAILLLDECDVFLEARTSNDLERNKLVSIFLRTLEYYEGILFLTTNRISNMDAAFQSRIHVSMAYPDLTTASRRQIWKNFLTLSKQKSEISETDLDALAQVNLNGRQIKNVLKTSFLLSNRKKSPLKREFVEVVLAIEGRRPDGGYAE